MLSFISSQDNYIQLSKLHIVVLQGNEDIKVTHLHAFLLEVEFGCVLAAATAAKLPTIWLLSPELGELLLGVH